ncbi:hypothetical protein GC173_01300 [bacterium]|nr:hypothetical protein [bacterium]
MSDLLYIVSLLAMIWAVSDVLRLMPAGVARNLWLFAVIVVPILGPLYWYYIQHIEVKRRRVERERR